MLSNALWKKGANFTTSKFSILSITDIAKVDSISTPWITDVFSSTASATK